MASKIPPELRNRKQWVLWKTVTRDGRDTKLPFQADGKPAKSNEPSTWTDFSFAMQAASNFQVGFVFAEADTFCGIDLDGCRDPVRGDVAHWAKTWINRFDSYSEVSPSKTGVKIFVRGKNPLGAGRKTNVETEFDAGKQSAVEIYDSLRYFAVTGWRLGGVSPNVEERQDVLEQFCVYFFPKQVAPAIVADWSSDEAVCERARKYLSTMPPAIAGQSGHNQTFHAACVLTKGFVLNESQALALLAEFNARCEPPWTEKELRHKVASAMKADGPSGYLRDVPVQRWEHTQIPDYKKKAPQPKIDYVTLADAAELYLNDLSAGKANLIELGISDLDHALGGGVAGGEMVIIASRPSHGKSAASLQCLDTAAKSGIKGLMISEEMSTRAIGKRTIQYASSTPEEHWRTSKQDVVRDLGSHFAVREMVYVVEGCRTAKKCADTIEHFVEHEGVGIAVVDYAQLLSSPGHDRYQQVTETSIALRGVANSTGIVLLVLCQLNRQIESRGKFHPRPSDLKDSGQLEQDADVVVFSVWPHRIDPKNDPNLYQFFVNKNRNRAINMASFDCRFEPSRQRILDSAKTVKYSDFGSYSEETF